MLTDGDIKEIVIALIEQKLVFIGETSEETGEEIGKLFNSIRNNTNI